MPTQTLPFTSVFQLVSFLIICELTTSYKNGLYLSSGITFYNAILSKDSFPLNVGFALSFGSIDHTVGLVLGNREAPVLLMPQEKLAVL